MAEDGEGAGLRNRPRPPQSLLSIDSDTWDGLRFIPAPDLVQWISTTFLEEGAPLENPEHHHLRDAKIGALWTTVENGRNGRTIVGQAEMGQHIGGMGKWNRAKAEQQAIEWFDCIPDFIITLYAPYADSCSDEAFLALCEHELYHCAQENDEFGIPRFKKSTGLPAFCLRAHCVEEFIGVVRRYGMIGAGVAEMVRAANEGPEIAPALVSHACGTCLK